MHMLQRDLLGASEHRLCTGGFNVKKGLMRNRWRNKTSLLNARGFVCSTFHHLHCEMRHSEQTNPPPGCSELRQPARADCL